MSVVPESIASKEQRASLDLISWSEGADYNTIVTGVDGPHTFDNFRDHPFADGRPPIIVRESPLLESTAAGRYQLLYRYWKVYQHDIGLHDFSPLSQDLVALRQMRERHAHIMLLDGDIEGAIKACSAIWASLPGNSYGQGGHTMEELIAKYNDLLGEYEHTN